MSTGAPRYFNPEDDEALGQGVGALDTPSIVVDLDKVDRNIASMATVAAAYGVALRPHVKTHKSPSLARRQLAAGAMGVTVAKLDEAEVFAAAGCDDILLAYQVVGPRKMPRLIDLARRIRIQSCIDDLRVAEELSRAAVHAGVRLEVLVDVETGLGRTGVPPEQAVELGTRAAALPGLQVNGAFSYAGYRVQDPDPSTRRAWARQEAETAAAVAAALRDAAVAATTVSVAGTCCAPFAVETPGVTEVRPGTYIFGDANYMRLGATPSDSCALTVRSTIVNRPVIDRAVLDAGTKVLAADPPSVLTEPAFGHLPHYPGSRIHRAWEEHAVVELADPDRGLRVGDVVDIVPNHVCPVVNLTDRWYGVRDGVVTEIHTVAARGLVR